MDLAMASSELLALKAPQWPQPPARPADDFWSEAQWAVFMAIMDAIIPSIVPQSSQPNVQEQLAVPDTEFVAASKTALQAVAGVSSEDASTAYLRDRPSTNPVVRGALLQLLASLPSKRRDALGMLLSTLSSSISAFLLTGYYAPFHQHPVHIRESIIKGWHDAWLPTMRTASRSLVKFAQICWLNASPLFRQVTGYPEVPLNWKPALGFDFKFIQFPPGPAAADNNSPNNDDKTMTIDTDVIIIGSGCGGGVAAKVLAEAGHRVMVVDKGYYFPPSMLPLNGASASRFLFDRGASASINNSIGVSAGSNWGGGGTVNWSVSLQTQDFVRKEWAAAPEDGGAAMGFFDTAEYQQCMDRVCERMGVATEPVKQSHRGQVLLDGCRKLGWKAGVCPQNSGGAEHSCGHCTMGCGSNEKMGPAACWLPDAARAGAEFIEGFEVERVVLDNGRATGVVGTWRSRDAKGGIGGPLEDRIVKVVKITAKRVIVSCGALRTPLLLLRSGLKNPHIGRNLHLHPCYMVGAFFKEDTCPWEGAIISSYCTEFENMDGKGHGVKLETTNMTPFTCYFPRPWRGGLDLKLATLRYRRMAAYISVTRDRDAGRVYPDPATGELLIDYTPSAFDRAHALEGNIAVCKVLYVTGAREIDAYVHGVEPFVREDWELSSGDAKSSSSSAASPSVSSSSSSSSSSSITQQDGEITDSRFLAWLDQVRRLGANPDNVSVSSAHQMGTCRMSATEDRGVVDVRGKVWDTEGLYVADTSVFPSASGVNPMVTVMALADWIARAVDADLKGQQ